MARLGYLVRMALKDLAGEWTVSLAVCLAIAAVAAPILVLLGLYAGVIGEIFGGLRSDPAAREVRLEATGSARFQPEWFDQIRTLPEVAFAVPATRYASTQVQAFDATGERERRTSLLPTGAGDPLFGADARMPAQPTEAGISATLAEALGVAEGGTVTLEVTRRAGGRDEAGFVTLTIISVTKAADFERDALFVTLPLMVEIEDFKDGAGAPLLGVAGPPPGERTYYPDFRLYARDVADVGPLIARLSAEPYNLSVRGQTGRIDFAMDLSSSLQLVIAAIAALGIVGLAGGLATIQWSMAARRRRIIAVLSLIGFRRGALIGFPVIQAACLGLCGAVLTVVAALGFSAIINTWLAGALGAGAARIGAGPALGVTALILVISILPALVIGLRYSNLEPADEIRET